MEGAIPDDVSRYRLATQIDSTIEEKSEEQEQTQSLEVKDNDTSQSKSVPVSDMNPSPKHFDQPKPFSKVSRVSSSGGHTPLNMSGSSISGKSFTDDVEMYYLLKEK